MNSKTTNMVTVDIEIINSLYKLVLELKSELMEQRKDIKYILSKMNNSSNRSERDIFNEVRGDINKEKVKKYLCNNSILSDVNLVKDIYLSNLDKSKHSIKYNRCFYYWNNEWIKNDNYLFNKLINIIKQQYLSVNTFDNFKNNISLMINNQNYISSIGKKLYLIEFKKKLKENI